MLPRLLHASRLLRPSTPSSLTPHFLLPRVLPPTTRARIQSAVPPSHILLQLRHATHKASRAANGARSPAGRRLGAKKSAGEFVKIGNIIFRQKGTLWYPGENVKMGRDHTIFAMQPGYVRFYKDPRQPKRKFIGVALHINQTLPRPENAARVRRLGYDVQVLSDAEMRKFEKAERETAVNDEKMVGWVTPQGSYQPRMTGWRIGKFMDERPARIQPKNKRGWIRLRKKRDNTKIKGAKQLIESQAEGPKKQRNMQKKPNAPGIKR